MTRRAPGRMSARTAALAGLILLAAVVAVVGVAAGIKDFVRDWIVVPLSYLAWLGGLILTGIPQYVLLLALVGLGAAAALRGLAGLRRPEAGPANPSPQARTESRLSYWQHHLSQLDTSSFSREKVALEMRSLVLQVLADRERRTPDEIEQSVRAGDLQLPGEVRLLIVDWPAWLGRSPGGRWRRVASRLAWIARPGRGTSPGLSPRASTYFARVDHIARFLESGLQGVHDPITPT